ncbi:hypothetical protein Tco_0012626 [Tanacetum coccineum]
MASQSASDSATTGVGSTSALGIREIIQTTRNNEIWKDFNMCIMTNGQKKAQCKHCFNFLSVGSNTTLKHHISHPHCEVLKAQQNQNPEAGQTSMGRDGQIFMFNPDYLREQFAGLVIQRGLPFNHFDHEQTTRVFQNTMQPRYTHVSRSTLKRDAMKLWVAAKQATIDGFEDFESVFVTNFPEDSPARDFEKCVVAILISHLHANYVRFERPSKTKSFIPRGHNHSTPKETNTENSNNSFDSVLSGGRKGKKTLCYSSQPMYDSKEGFKTSSFHIWREWVLFEFDSLTTKEKFLNHSGIGSWFTELIQATNSFENDERIV